MKLRQRVMRDPGRRWPWPSWRCPPRRRPRPRRPIRFDRLSLEQGLSQSTVMDVLQDRRGYIWLATEDGLNRYDGLAFKVYKHDPADAASLPGSFVWDVEEDARRQPLDRHRAAASPRWERATDRFVRQDERWPAAHIRALRFAKKDNALWIGTRDGGLLRLDVASRRSSTPLRARRRATPAASPTTASTRSTSTARAGSGSARDGGLDRLDADGKGFTHFAPNAARLRRASATPRCARSLADDTGALWVGTSSGGLNRLDAATGRVRALPPRRRRAAPASPTTRCARSCRTPTAGCGWAPAAASTCSTPRAAPSRTTGRTPATRRASADDHVLVAGPGPRRRALGGHAPGRRPQVEPAELAVRPRRARRPTNPTGLGSGHVTSFSEDRAGPALDRDLRRRPLRDGPHAPAR